MKFGHVHVMGNYYIRQGGRGGPFADTEIHRCTYGRIVGSRTPLDILSSQGPGAWVEQFEEALDELASVASETELLICVLLYGSEPVEPGFDVITSTNLGCEFTAGVFDSSILLGNCRSVLFFFSGSDRNRL